MSHDVNIEKTHPISEKELTTEKYKNKWSENGTSKIEMHPKYKIGKFL